MAAGNKGTRISKVARELNVGISTIVEFLNKKGADLDSNPNNKISDEQYDLLLKEYGSDLSLKKKSKSITLKSKQETVSINDNKEDAPEEDSNEEELIVKGQSPDNIIETEEPKERIELKVVGKVELEKKAPAQKPEPKQEKPEKEKKQEAAKPAPKPVEKKIEAPVVKKNEKVSEPVKKEPQEKPKAEKPVEKKEEKPIVKDVPEKTAAVEEKTPNVADKVKVVGKIDLSSINSKTRPAKKTKKQKEDERKEREKKRKDDFKSRNSNQDNRSNDNRGQGEDGKKKISGPKIVGKIDLPGGGDKNNNSDQAGKKKRKRIKKDSKVDIDNTNKKITTPELKKNKGNNNNAKRRNASANKRPVRKEVSEEDVQKQIKETLARLTSKGKSKGSKHRRDKRDAVSQKHQEEMAKQEQEKNVLKVTEFVSVNELATMMSVQVTEVIATCMNMGLFVSINQRLDAETIGLVADEFNFKTEFISVEVQEAIKEEEDSEEDLVERSPIITVMGHVDHGKTSLLDHIRKANVIAGEAGGITQHIGAYNVELSSGRKITFLDTPGHEAFTAMRARGAQVTDIAIIIVAADDSVMPQTIEAINHASAAGVPIVFAINKIDKPGANPEKIKEELANMNYLVEEWGGKYQSQDISAKNGINIEELLEKVLLEADMLELKANPNKSASGTVIESALDKGRGYVTTILNQNGTLKNGDIILAGSYMGRVKAMFNERNKKIDKAGPATPVLILGLNGAPQAGDNFNIMATEREAKEIATKRLQLQREQGLRTQKHITLDEIGRRIAIGNFQELNVIVKGDVDGSIEALSDSLIKLSTEEIQVNVIHKGVGQISESDVMLASASDAIIVGFQVRPSMGARKLAEKEEIDIRLYSIIYDAINEIKDAMEGMLSPEIKEEVVSTIEVRETFKISKVGTIAGCMVKEGKIHRNTKIRLIRDGIVIYTGELGALKRFKDDVKEVASGYECGLNINNFNDIKVGDIIEGYEEVEVKKKL
jgi:translation initiation factor IF-2